MTKGIVLALFALLIIPGVSWADKHNVIFSGSVPLTDPELQKLFGKSFRYEGELVVDDTKAPYEEYTEEYPNGSDDIAWYYIDVVSLKFEGKSYFVDLSDEGSENFSMKVGDTGSHGSDYLHLHLGRRDVSALTYKGKGVTYQVQVGLQLRWPRGTFLGTGADNLHFLQGLEPWGKGVVFNFKKLGSSDRPLSLFDEDPTVGANSSGPAGKFGYPVGEGECSAHSVDSYHVTWDMNHKDIGPDGTTYPEHTGEDWNRGSGREDYGDLVCAIGDGKVITAENFGGAWGNVVVIEHKLSQKVTRWSQYAHLKDLHVIKGNVVKRGEKIGTIGDGGVNGAIGPYSPHLHLEVRKRKVSATNWPFDPNIYLDPSDKPTDLYPDAGFIESN